MSMKNLKMVQEKHMTASQKKKREDIVKGMKSQEKEFKDKYGDRWEEVMYATATKQAMKKKKVTEGVLDSTDEDGWMAKSQLYKLAKYSAELHKMIQDSDDLEPWVQAKITTACEDIGAVKQYMEYLAVENADQTMDNIVSQDQHTVDSDIDSLNLDDVIRPIGESKKSLRNSKDNPCWDGYEPIGTKKIKNKIVPNCVPKK